MANTNYNEIFKGLKDTFNSVLDAFSDIADEHEEKAATAQQEVLNAFKRYRTHIRTLVELESQMSEFAGVIEDMTEDLRGGIIGFDDEYNDLRITLDKTVYDDVEETEEEGEE